MKFPCIYHQLPTNKKIVVGFSGGLDSSLLLMMLYQSLKNKHEQHRLRAIHVNHNLHPQSHQWAEHCQAVGRFLNIPVSVEEVTLKGLGNIESQAREARLGVFKRLLKAEEDCLCLAHHQADQAETILYRLLRGSGLKGLSGIQGKIKLGNLHIVRPLLLFPKSSINQWAESLPFDYIEDPSNQSLDFDRNYIRHQVMPVLKKRWPMVENSLIKTANYCAEIDSVLDESIRLQFERFCGKVKETLSVKALLSVSKSYRQYLIRFWLSRQQLPTISQKMHAELEQSVLAAKTDASPILRVGHYEFRRYRDDLYILPVMDKVVNLDTYTWQPQLPLQLKDGRRLCWKNEKTRPNQSFTVRFRQKGDKLKAIFQKFGIPPWMRASVPLIYDQETLKAIPGYWEPDHFKDIILL